MFVLKSCSFFDYNSDQMAARPVSASGDRRSASLYSQSNDIPEITRFKVFIINFKINF
jgi:hypothetical protein